MRRTLLLGILMLPIACSDAPVSVPKAGPLLTVVPCAPNDAPPQSGECGEWEEEVFGNVFDLNDPLIQILPRDGTTLVPYLNTSVWIDRRTGENLTQRHGNEDAHYGWYGFGAHDQCADQENRRGNTYERHWNSATSQPGAALHYPWPPPLWIPDDAFEDHCLKLGAYVLQTEGGGTYRRPIDFISYSPAFQAPPGSISPAIENPGVTIGGNDVVVHFDGTSDGSVASPVIEADVVTDRTAPWVGAAVIAGSTITLTPGSILRVGAWKSTETWTVESRGRVMVRYFWNYDGLRSHRTGFVNAHIEDRGNIRIRQFMTPGTYRVVAQLAQPDEFGADDNADWGASLSFTVRVSPPDAAFSFSPGSPLVGQSVTFNASASVGVAPLSYKWSFGDGTPETAWLTNPVTTHTYSSAGTWPVVLTVRDWINNTDVANATVTVTTPPPPDAAFNFSPGSPVVGQSVTFNASASTGVAPLSYKWNFGDGSPETAWLTSAVTTHTYSSTGNKSVVLTVRDGINNTDVANDTVTVTTPPPLTAAIVGPTSVRPRTMCEWVAVANGGTVPYTYLWELNGIVSGSGELFQVRSGSGGQFTLRLTVNSADGQTRNVTRTVNVSASAPVCYL